MTIKTRLVALVISSILIAGTNMSPILGQADHGLITPANAFRLKQVELLEYSSGVESLAFGPGSSTLLSGHVGGEIRVLSLEDGTSHVMNSGNPTISRLLLSPDGTRLVSSGASPSDQTNNAPPYNTVQVWDIQTGIKLTTLTGDRLRFAKSISVSPSGHFVAIAGASGKFNVWMTGEALLALTGDTDPTQYVLVDEWWTHGECYSVAFNPTDHLFACGRADGTIALSQWQSFDRVEPLVLHGHSHHVIELLFDPNGLILASGDLFGVVRIWDMSTGTGYTLYPQSSSLQTSPPRMAFSPDAQILAITSTRSNSALAPYAVQLLEVETGTELVSLSHESPITDIAFSPDGISFASASLDGTIRLWRIP